MTTTTVFFSVTYDFEVESYGSYPHFPGFSAAGLVQECLIYSMFVGFVWLFLQNVHVFDTVNQLP